MVIGYQPRDMGIWGAHIGQPRQACGVVDLDGAHQAGIHMDVDDDDGVARGKAAFNAVVAGFDAENFARHL